MNVVSWVCSAGGDGDVFSVECPECFKMLVGHVDGGGDDEETCGSGCGSGEMRVEGVAEMSEGCVSVCGMLGEGKQDDGCGGMLVGDGCCGS